MWQEIIGQDHAVNLLQRAIVRRQVSHAYLFAGPKGTGKRKAAVQFAKALFCVKGKDGDSCDQCYQCRRIESGNHPDFRIVEPEGASLKIEQIRGLRKEFNYSGVESDRKVYIVQDADKMTREAANSLLKFLEEPWEGITAILLTTNLNGVLPTILSRCQIIPFRPLPWNRIAEQAVAKGISPGDARVAAKLVGSPEEVALLCQQESFAQLRKIVIQFYQEVLANRMQAFLRLQEYFDSFFKEEAELVLDLLLVWVRDLLSVHLEKEEWVANIEYLEDLRNMARKTRLRQITHQLDLLQQTRNRLKYMNHQLAFERLIFQL